MTITEIMDQAKSQYNATGDTFFPDSELMGLIFQACMQLATKALIIEGTATANTVIGTQEYSYPTGTIALKRVTYNGVKLKPINFREDDALTSNNSITTDSGTPQYYYQWNGKIGLRPIPDTVKAIKYYTYQQPAALSVGVALEIPTRTHPEVVGFLLSNMYAKDKDFSSASYYLNLWNQVVETEVKWAKKKRRQDGFAVVQAEEVLAETILGYV